MTSAIKAMADIINRAIAGTCPTPWYITSARCNVTRCGMSYCAYANTDNGAVFAGMIPVKMCPSLPTAALVELPGTPADPRQRYDTAFDNPSMTLHIIGDDMVALDTIAQEVIEKLDRTGHYDTIFGTVNGIRIGPPRRTVRKDRPRYDLQLTIDMEVVR